MVDPSFNRDEHGRAEVVPITTLPTLEFDAGVDATWSTGTAVPMTILPALESQLTRVSDPSSTPPPMEEGPIVSVRPPEGQSFNPLDMAELTGALDTLQQKGYRVERVGQAK